MDAVNTHLLSRARTFATADVDELKGRLSSLFSVRSLDLPRNIPFEAVLAHRQISEVGLTYARYGTPINAMVEQSDYYLQGFPLRGRGDAVIDKASGTLSRNYGVIGGPGARLALRYSADFEHLIVRIRPEGLIRKLSVLIDGPVDPPLLLTSDVIQNESQFRLLEFVVGELDRGFGEMPPILLAEMEQAIIVAFLANARHNYSRRLDGGGDQEVAPWHVRRAEEYIREHWDKPMTIEALAAAANTSARNLFHTFKKSRGVSPMTFARRVRLAEARARLVAAVQGATVTSIAFECGFGNLGAFARYYEASYGELPSKTLQATNRSH